MPRISGINIPDNKRIEIALTYIYGIGRALSNRILKETKIDSNKLTSQLSEGEISKIRSAVDDKKIRVEGDLRREIMMNVKRLKEIGSYRGLRHTRGLPAHGQQTRTNSRTVRGNVRRTMGSGKRKMEKT